jgi:hypothetical protein
MVGKKHSWVTFVNPRNGKVRLRACERCGMLKDNVSKSMSCELVADSKHAMKRTHWKILDQKALDKVALDKKKLDKVA